MIERVEVTIDGGTDIEFPYMVKVRQIFSNPEIADIEAEVAKELDRPAIRGQIGKGQKIAIAVGSRGIANLSRIVKALVDNLKKYGAEPIIVPAMGSHGGATAEGQKELIADYGITEENMGVPIISSMEVVQIAALDDGYPVYLDKVAYECDGIIPVNRVKPHTDYKGTHESGLFKMMAIGLGKHKGAAKIHTQGFGEFYRLIPELGNVILKNANILFGLAILENAYDHTAYIHAVDVESMYEKEIALTKLAKTLMPKFLVSDIDLLIVDEIGKEISGSGMDPNIVGRSVSKIPGIGEGPPIKKIVVLDLSDNTHGNATGIGLADATTLNLVRKVDFGKTYANAICSTELDGGKLPIFLNNDKEAIAVAAKTCNKVELESIKIIRIKNTLEMSEIEVSLPLYEEMKGRKDVEILSEPYPMQFDENGKLL